MEFFAHINIENNKKQTVRDHSLNVSNFAENNAKSIGLSNLMKIIGILHDLGKNKYEFQEYLDHSVNGDGTAVRGSVNHTTAGARYLYQLICDNKMYNDEYDILLVQIICYSIMTHHGLIDCIDNMGADKYSQKLFSSNETNMNEIIDNSKSYINDNEILKLFVKAKGELKETYNKIKKIGSNMRNSVDLDIANSPEFFMLSNLQRLINSFLVDADRKDTNQFMSNIIEKQLNKEELSLLWNDFGNKLEKRIEMYKINNDISKLRNKISNDCLNFAKNNINGIYKLDVPTGGGKTLASMRFALEFAKNNNKQHIYYIAPYISILEQNAKEYRSIFDDDENVLEHHSNVIIEDGKKNDELQNYEVLLDNWNSPIILTTMVRFLEVLFDGSNSNVRRFHQLKNSIVILDEAQQIPIKCVYMFNTMINFLSNICNSTFIFCTATQPLFNEVKYPLLYSENCDIIPNDENLNKAFKRNNIVYCRNTETKKYKKQDLIDLIKNKINNVNNILVILNTKSAVRDLYNDMNSSFSDNIDILQLTTYMCPKHRLDVISSIKHRLSILSSRKMILVSTQLIEAGVDISFEMVIRSLTGIDGIMQAAGRCNRNGEKNSSEVLVIDYQDECTISLKDINLAKQSTNNVMLNESDLISITNKDVNQYYKQYFFDRESEMCYNIANNENIYNLLSENTKNNREYKKINNNCDVEYYLRQAYKTAGNEFNVIDNNAVSVITRFAEANEFINEYKNKYTIDEKKLLLKKLQRYTISLNKNDKMFKSLIERKGLTYLDDENQILVLDKDYYSDNGVTDELKVICI